MQPILPILALHDNYIWAYIDNLNRLAYIVDPGDADPVIETLEKMKLNLDTILLTHHHLDHSGGIKKLKGRWNAISVIGSENSPCQYLTHRIKEGDSVKCGSFVLHVLDIPGHTLDHVAYYNDTVLFCGDTLFSAGCGKVFEGTYSQMYHSLAKLSRLSDTTKVYCGHEYTLANLQFAKKVEPENLAIEEKIILVTELLENNIPSLPSMLSIEKQINPFLRCGVRAVIESVENHVGKKLMGSEEVFACLREWKNSGK